MIEFNDLNYSTLQSKIILDYNLYVYKTSILSLGDMS